LASGVFLLVLAVFACSQGGDITEQVSGKWSRTTGDGTVQIQLAEAPQMVVIDGHKYNAVVEKVDMDKYSVIVKVQDDAGKTAMWTLQQKWDDIGKTFKLAFDHDGNREILVNTERS
jgi:hypothetical protein